MKRPLRTTVLSLLLAMNVSILLSSPAPGSGSPDFNPPTFTYSVEAYVVFSFTDNSNEDDHYVVNRSNEDGTVSFVTDLAGNSPGEVQQFDDSNARGGYYYTYYVDAVLQNGTTLPRVAEVTFMQPLEGAVFSSAPPFWEMCGSEILVQFNRIDESPNTSTEIYRSTSSGSGFALVATTTDNYYEDDVAPRHTYYYKLRTVRDGQASPFSEVKSYTVGDDYHAPQFTATPVANGVQITLVDKTYHEDYYRILKIGSDEYGVLQGNFSLPDSGSTFTMVDTAVVAGNSYTYELYAKAKEYCDKYSWPWDLERSAYIDVTMPSDEPVPAPVMIMDDPAEETCGSEVIIEFDGGNIPGITTQIFRSTSPTSGFVQVGSTTGYSYFDDVAPRKTYYYKVRNARGEQVSEFSEVKSVAVESDYYDPDFSVTLGDGGVVTVRLKDNTYADEYYHIEKYGEEPELLYNELVMADSGRTFIFTDTLPTNLVDTRSYTYLMTVVAVRPCDKYSWPRAEERGNVEITIPGTGVCPGAGSITRDLWTNVSGATIADIPVNTTPTSSSEITVFETPNYAGNNYAARIRGYVCVPQSGVYTFWLASDDQGVLYLSTNDNPANKQQIARVDKAVKFREYTKYASQQSATVFLSAGEKYYIEALHKEANGADHISVRWRMPDGTMEAPIQGNRLLPYEDEPNQLPTVVITSPPDYDSGEIGSSVTIEADASDPDGTITRVEFYANNNKIGEDAIAPYAINWQHTVQGSYRIAAIAYDDRNGVASDTVYYSVNYHDCDGVGYIEQEIWFGIEGTDISSIPVNTNVNEARAYVEFETDRRLGNNYGSRMRAYLCVPTTGNYTFWISADDKAELWLSTDSDPANKRIIASVNRATNYREYNKYASQQSVSIYLDKNVNYYIEALHKEGTADDHLSVGWQLPDGTLQRPIQAHHLIAIWSGTHATAQNGIEEAEILLSGDEGGDIMIYPNPVSSGRRVSIKGGFAADGPSRVQILSLTGMVVHDQEISLTDSGEVTIDLSPGITSGIYAVQVLQGRKKKVVKLVVK